MGERNNDQGCAVVFWIIVAWLFFCGLASTVLGSSGNHDNVVRDKFDMIEVNHYYDQWGNKSFVQLIYWDWDGRNSKFKCQGWKMMKDALVKTEEGAKKHEKMVDKLCEKKSLQFIVEIRKNMRYTGDFVGGQLMPKRDYHRRIWTVRFIDGKNDREIRAKIFRETHSQFDPEKANREFYPEDTRRGLTDPK